MKSVVRPTSSPERATVSKHAHGRGPHGEHALRRGDSVPGGPLHGVALAVERVRLETRLGHRTKGVESDVQRHTDGSEQLDELRGEMETRGRSGGRPFHCPVHRLVTLRLGERLVDVRGKRHLAARLTLHLDEPATAASRLAQPHGAEALTDPDAPRRPHERLPHAVVSDALEEQHLDRAPGLAAHRESRGHDARVVHDDLLAVEQRRKLGEGAMLDRSAFAPVDEQTRCVPWLDRRLRDELGRKLVIEERSVHPALRVASPPMDSLALERAKQRIADAAAGRPERGAIEAALERSRDQVEALAVAAAELEASIPAHVGVAVRDGLRIEVLPVARHIAEIRGLLNQAIRRLERLEGDLLAERHARVDDLALLVELVSSGWRGVDARLERLGGLPRRAGGRSARTRGRARAASPTVLDRAAAA